MPSSLKETQAISEIAEVLYRFLPGKSHPYAAADISFPGVASKLGLSKFWIGGSKKPAIIQLLQATLDYRRDQFCNLILEIIRMGIAYLSNKGEPVTREEIINLNQLIKQFNFKISELWEPSFLDSLPSSQPTVKAEANLSNQQAIEKLRSDLILLLHLKPQDRGFAFEKFLNALFAAYNLDPRGSFTERLINKFTFQMGKPA